MRLRLATRQTEREGGCPAQCYRECRLEYLPFPAERWPRCADFLWSWRTVARWPILNHVGNEHVCAIESNRFEQATKHDTTRANEWSFGSILFCSRSLTNHHNSSRLSATNTITPDKVNARLAEFLPRWIIRNIVVHLL
jgi:hypothetical protein